MHYQARTKSIHNVQVLNVKYEPNQERLLNM